MSRGQFSETGLLLYGGISLLVVAGSVLVAMSWRPSPLRSLASVAPRATGARSTPIEHAPNAAGEGAEPGAAASMRRGVADVLVDRYVALASAEVTDLEEEQMTRIAAELVALGETAVPALVARIDGFQGAPSVRDRLFDVLRRLPGRVAEERLIREARSGRVDSSRTLAMEALAQRRTDRAMEALSRIAETDPDLPAQAFIASPRDPNDTSTELPDEVAYTPRMRAILALASTGEPRAAEVLTGLLRDSSEESLRMYAARNLETLRDAPGAVDALRKAATGDVSPYVRLAALHALTGSSDRTLLPMLENIAARDADAGVRALARQVLASLLP